MIYLLSGVNTHSKATYFSHLREKLNQYALSTFYCDEKNVDVLNKIHTVLSQISLFDASLKLIYLRNFIKADFLEELYSMLPGYLEDKNVVIVLDTDDVVRANARILKIVKKNNVLVSEPYTTAYLTKYVMTRLAQGGVENAAQIAQVLITTVEQDPYYLENEVDKIILFCKRNGGVTLAQVREMVMRSSNNSIWEYLKNITYGDKYKAIGIATNMLMHGENEYAMLAMILWNLKLISIVKSGSAYSDERIAKDFGFSSYSVRNARNIMHRFSFAKLSLLYEKVVDLDYKIKMGTMDPKFGIILLSYIF